jgi:KUP system potassium uptake protein
MVVWFLALALLGVLQIVREPSVLTCLAPWQGLELFARNGWTGFLVLGSVFLAVTGGEALYADMGHFGVAPIRMAWFAFVFPSLLLNYLGQGALMIREPAAAENPFFRMVPTWGVYPMVVLATAATVIASQALISGAFSLTMQAVQFGFLPRLKVDHTSDRQVGQIYVPFVNWALMVACVGLVLGFGSSSRLAAAYGVAVTATMLITTLLFFYLSRYVWGWGLGKAGLVCGLFLVVEAGFLGANLLKVAHGGWFPLLVGIGFYLVMSTWRKGREALARQMARLSVPWSGFMEGLKARPPKRVPGTAVFMSGNPDSVPVALVSNMRHNHVLHERVILLRVDTANRPHIPDSERHEVVQLEEWLHRVTLRFGYMDSHDVPCALGALVLPQGPVVPRECTYFLGRETVLPRRGGNSGMPWWRERLFAVLCRNARNATYFFGLPVQRVFEVGNMVEI